MILREHNVTGVCCKDYTLNLTLTLRGYFYITSSRWRFSSSPILACPYIDTLGKISSHVTGCKKCKCLQNDLYCRVGR